MAEFNSYELSRNWFDWCFENTDKINSNHTALYFFIIEHCNRLGWKEKFGLPTTMTMDALGIKNYKTYSKTFDNLVEWGFIRLIEKSKNQWSATIIALVKNTKANTKALTKASLKHSLKQVESIVSIDKPNNLITIKPNNISFDCFWNLYNKKIGDKNKCESKWNKLKDEERQKIIDTLPTFLNSITDKQFQPFPETYLNNKRWNDEILNNVKKQYNFITPNGHSKKLLTESEYLEIKKNSYYTEI